MPNETVVSVIEYNKETGNVLINGTEIKIDVPTIFEIETKGYGYYLEVLDFFGGRLYLDTLVNYSNYSEAKTRKDFARMEEMGLVKIRKSDLCFYVTIQEKGLRYLHKSNDIIKPRNDKRSNQKGDALIVISILADLYLMLFGGELKNIPNGFRTSQDIADLVYSVPLNFYEDLKELEFRGYSISQEAEHFVVDFAQFDDSPSSNVGEHQFHFTEEGSLPQIPTSYSSLLQYYKEQTALTTITEQLVKVECKRNPKRFNRKGTDALSRLMSSNVYLLKIDNLNFPITLHFYIIDKARSLESLRQILKRIDVVVSRLNTENMILCRYTVTVACPSSKRLTVVQQQMTAIVNTSKRIVDKVRTDHPLKTITSPDFLGKSYRIKNADSLRKGLLNLIKWEVLNTQSEHLWARKMRVPIPAIKPGNVRIKKLKEDNQLGLFTS